MSETKKTVSVETEWRLEWDEGTGHVLIAHGGTPAEVLAAAEALEREHVRPKPLSDSELQKVADEYRVQMSYASTTIGSYRAIARAAESRVAEIAAWDAKHNQPAPPVWQKAPERYPEDGWYWRLLCDGECMCPARRDGGEPVPSDVTHIGGPIPEPVMPEGGES